MKSRAKQPKDAINILYSLGFRKVNVSKISLVKNIVRVPSKVLS